MAEEGSLVAVWAMALEKDKRRAAQSKSLEVTIKNPPDNGGKSEYPVPTVIFANLTG
jgi:hypothetical protein